MKSTRTKIIIAMIGAALVLAVGAVAQGPHHGGPDGEFNHMLKVYTEKLDLTADQQSQMQAIWAKEKPTLQPLMQQEHQNRAAMKALTESGPFDEVKTRTLATSNAQTMIELQVAHARIKSEMMQVLTPDQKTKLQQIEAERKANWKQHAAPPPTE